MAKRLEDSASLEGVLRSLKRRLRALERDRSRPSLRVGAWELRESDDGDLVATHRGSGSVRLIATRDGYAPGDTED